MKSSAYYGGLAAGIGVAIIILVAIMIIKKKKDPAKPQFDEMQLAARGKAFKSGFFSLLIANFVGIILSTSVDPAKIPTFFIFAATSMIGAAIFVISAIRSDAYFGFNENKKSSTIFIAAMGIINLAVGCLNILGRGLYDDGELNVAVLNFLVALLSAVIVVAVLLHNKAAKTTEEDE